MKLRPERERDEARADELKTAVQDTKRINANVPASLHNRLKVYAAMHDREMTDVLIEALEKYLP